MLSILETQDDLEWLRDVHKVPIDGVRTAIVFGNEDWPDKVMIYKPDYMTGAILTASYMYPPESDGSAMVSVTYDSAGNTVYGG